jgi:predicted HicB family RNase H-like nuclease
MAKRKLNVVKSICPKCKDEWTMYKGHSYKCPICEEAKVKEKCLVKTLIIKNMPEDLHKDIKVLAAQQGKTLQDLVIEALRDKLK